MSTTLPGAAPPATTLATRIASVDLIRYVAFAVAIVILYFPCRWFADLKARRADWWLKYL